MKGRLEEKKKWIIGICLVLGIIFLILAEYPFGDKTNSAKEAVFDETAYTADLENRLCGILEKMEGVSQVSVMITLEGGISYHYASQTAKSFSGENESWESFLTMQEDSGGKTQPILTQTRLPKVKGASVVCQGAENENLRRRIIGLVASTLDLNENQIYVTE
jgi:stage III sporulation protein AG